MSYSTIERHGWNVPFPSLLIVLRFPQNDVSKMALANFVPRQISLMTAQIADNKFSQSFHCHESGELSKSAINNLFGELELHISISTNSQLKVS